VGYSKLVRQKQLRKAFVQFFLFGVIDYDHKRSDTSLHLTKAEVGQVLEAVSLICTEVFLWLILQIFH